MIVSASRRADIPAHYAPWMMHRLREGFALVPNPFNARQVRRVELAPEGVQAMVFWTRDPRPLLPFLKEIETMGHRFVFQFTLLEYPAHLHPGMPPMSERLDTFRALSEAVGPERVLWRYDPVLLTPDTGPDFHRRSFETLAKALAGHTRRVTVSLMEPYRKALARLRRLGTNLLAPEEPSLRALFTDMAALARSLGMEPLGCADEAGLEALGFSPGACVDAALLNSLFGLDIPAARDERQRPACRCAPSRDIGMYGACPAGCAYCYATSSFAAASAAHARHDPAWPALLRPFSDDAASGQEGLAKDGTTP